MRILWVNTNFMHPTNKGGSIRTLGMLQHLHRRHEIHFAAFADPHHPEGPRRAGEYSTRSYPFPHSVRDKRSPAFALELAAGLFSPLPLAVERFRSPELGRFLEELLRRERFDRLVVDHLIPASYFPDLEHAVLFQHNVETMIWRRHAEHAPDPVRKMYFRLQAARMLEFEGRVCRAVGHIVAVSQVDADTMRELFGVTNVSEIPTGVDLDYFSPPPETKPVADLVFVGSMDWLPNTEGVLYFVREVLPLIRRKRPNCTLAIAGRKPPAKISALAANDSGIIVTGTVPDIRPYLWGSRVSIVPLRVGGGTRMKIYESMAARVPLVSTTVGAEGLLVDSPKNIRIADTPEDFAAQCLELLDDAAERERMVSEAWKLVSTHFSWDHVARCFERILESAPGPPPTEHRAAERTTQLGPPTAGEGARPLSTR